MNPQVNPEQTEYFEDGYCPDATPYWCFNRQQCAAIDTCQESIGQEWADGSLDYNCDGEEEAFDASDGADVLYTIACFDLSTPDCSSPDAPVYAVDSSTCGGIGEHKECVADGDTCSYKSFFTTTKCR